MADLPQSMTAIEISTPGGPDVLKACVRPMPVPGPGEVLVKTAFAGVNRPDVVQRMGLYPPPADASDLPGLEISGEVVALGEGADPGLLGRNVCALVSGGGYAGPGASPDRADAMVWALWALILAGKAAPRVSKP